MDSGQADAGGKRPPRGEEDRVDGPQALTAREEAVLRAIAGGKSNRETALALAISERTVEIHRKNIKRKLGVATADELTRYAAENGMIEP